MKAVLLIVILGLAVGVGCGGGDDAPPVDATPTADASFGALDAAGTCGATPLYQACTGNDDCSSCLCHSYNAAGLLCSKSCMRDEDCEAPSPGCNNMGVCKRPQ